MIGMPAFTAEYLKQVARRVFVAAGVSTEEAEIIAESLVLSNLMGFDSHGIIRVVQYLEQMEDGMIKPGGNLEVIRETPAMVIAKANWGFGQVAARQATDLVIEMARRTGLAAVAVSECNHVGRMGEYTGLIADNGMMGLATANGSGGGQRVAPWGGRERRLATNPISFAAPMEKGYPIVTDVATSVTSEGKVRVMRNVGKCLPEPWVINSQGEMSTDPNDLYGIPGGALLPLGGLMGHKGYALSIMVDILSGGLTSAGMAREGNPRFGNGFFIQAIDIKAFMPVDEFARRVQEFAAYLKSSAVAPGFERITLPGEPEYTVMAARTKDGINIDDETWRQVTEQAAKVGVTL